MRSVSIVYKLRGSSSGEIGNQVKRSVDEYYQQLIEKERVREEVQVERKEHINTIRVKNARQRLDKDEHQLFATINVMSMPVQKQLSARRESISRSQPRLMSSGRNLKSEKMLRGLNRPQAAFSEAKAVSVKEKSEYGKLRRMLKLKGENLRDRVMVLSVNFILNEFSFWQNEEVEEGCIRFWRELQNYANLVWVC